MTLTLITRTINGQPVTQPQTWWDARDRSRRRMQTQRALLNVPSAREHMRSRLDVAARDEAAADRLHRLAFERRPKHTDNGFSSALEFKGVVQGQGAWHCPTCGELLLVSLDD